MKLTMDKIRQMVADAARGSGNPGDVSAPWVQELMPESNATGTAILNSSGKLFEHSYQIVDGKVTLGDGKEVQQTYAPITESDRYDLLLEVGRVLSRKNEGVLRQAMDAIKGVLAALGPGDEEDDDEGKPAQQGQAQPIPKLIKKMFEAREQEFEGDVIPLIEKAVRADGTVPVKIISPGWGTSGYYSEEVIMRDGPKAFPKGTHMHWDHPTRTEEAERPERSLNTLAAVIGDDPVYQKNGPAGPGLYAPAKVRSAYRESVDDLAPHIGTSIRTAGVAKIGEAEGRKGKIIERILPGGTVDFVTTPGRGGEVLSLFEAARSRALSAPSDTEEELEESIHQEDDVSEEELREARAAAAEAQRKEQEAAERANRAEAALLLREASDVVTAELAGQKLPDFVRARLAGSLSANPPIKDGALDKDALKAKVQEAVKAEIAYLAKATGSGRVQGMGDGGTETSLSESGLGVTDDNASEKLVEAFKSMGMSDEAAKLAAAGRAN